MCGAGVTEFSAWQPHCSARPLSYEGLISAKFNYNDIAAKEPIGEQ